ncbi:MAG: hypothetical protein GAK35_02027 [Herbaspirillum frisingense]|uniref:BcpO-related WXXGXW repeat protein n=1 Tax=Herbaspirillum frisingense TaxID=92645 RepID=A0A7V8FWZ5_9BURK|nr:MAG: hypothetical protein GAK35_02027 [Herbaspirillum frisingense]
MEVMEGSSTRGSDAVIVDHVVQARCNGGIVGVRRNTARQELCGVFSGLKKVVIRINFIMKKIILAALIAAASSAAILPGAQAQVSVNINIGAPPPPRVERMPPPRHGYVWVPGYWDWNGHAHYWRSGRWVRERHGYVYAQPVWREGPRGWELDRGGWRGGPPAPPGPPPPPRYEHERHEHHGRDCPPGHARKGECW